LKAMSVDNISAQGHLDLQILVFTCHTTLLSMRGSEKKYEG
jgi:hypothetical protein